MLSDDPSAAVDASVPFSALPSVGSDGFDEHPAANTHSISRHIINASFFIHYSPIVNIVKLIIPFVKIDFNRIL